MRPHPPPRIAVDAHTHLLPPRLAAKIRQFFLQADLDPPGNSASCCSPGQGVFPYSASPHGLVDELVKELEEEQGSGGVPSVMWTLPYVHKPDISHALNCAVRDLALDVSAGGKLRVVPGLTCHPSDGESGGRRPEDILIDAVTGGAKVVKLHVSVGNHGVLDSRLSRFFVVAEALRIPVVVHAGRSVLGSTDPDELDEIGALAAQHPLLPVILAHAGHPSTSKALDLTRLYSNLYLDTTPVIASPVALPPLESTSLHPTSDAHHLLFLAHTGRVLFGSDSPTTGIRRADLAWDVRHWVRKCVASVMGAGNVEDAGGQMDKIAHESEEMVLGGAALVLEKNVRNIDEALRDLATREVPGKSRL